MAVTPGFLPGPSPHFSPMTLPLSWPRHYLGNGGGHCHQMGLTVLLESLRKNITVACKGCNVCSL